MGITKPCSHRVYSNVPRWSAPFRMFISRDCKEIRNPWFCGKQKKRNRKRTQETKDKIGASHERTLTKSIPKLAKQVGISESSAHRATKLLKQKPYKCTSVHSLKTRWPSITNALLWMVSFVSEWLFDSQLRLCSDHSWGRLPQSGTKRRGEGILRMENAGISEDDDDIDSQDSNTLIDHGHLVRNCSIKINMLMCKNIIMAHDLSKAEYVFLYKTYFKYEFARCIHK